MAEIREIYNKFARKYDDNPNCRQDSLGSAIEFASQGYFFAKWNIDLRGKSVLDIGCGTGRVAEAFKNMWKAKVFASDFSKEMAHIAKFRLKERVIVEDALDLCWKPAVFDFVNSSWAINHIENYRKAILEMARKTKKGGFVMITVVNPPQTANCIKDLEGNLRYSVSLFADDDGKPVNMLVFRRSKEEYVHAVEAAGLKILEISDKNLDELKKLGAIEEKTARKFDKDARNVRVNLSILAKKT